MHSNTPTRRWHVPIVVLVLTIAYYVVPWYRFGSASLFAGLPFLLLYVVLLPGALLRRSFGPERGDRLDALAASFLFGMAFFLSFAFLAALTGLSLPVFTKIMPAAVLTVSGLCWRLGRRTSDDDALTNRRGDGTVRIGLALLLTLVFVLVFRSGIPIDNSKDTLDHLGYVAEIVETGQVFPETAFYIDGDDNGRDLRKGLLHFFYGYACDYLSADVLQLIIYINAILAVVTLLAVYSTSLALFANRRMAVLAALLFLLGFWDGLSDVMIRISFYPNRFGNVFFLFFLVHALGYLDNRKGRNLPLAALFAFAACATHIFYAVVIVFAGLIIKIWKVCFPQNNWKAHLTRTSVLGTAVFAGILPYCLYRYVTAYPEANELHAEVQGAVQISSHLYFADPFETLKWFGAIGIATFLTLIIMWPVRGRNAALGFLFASYLTIPIVLFNPILLPPLHDVLTYLVFRLNMVCPFYLLTSFFLVTVLETWRSSPRMKTLKIIVSALILIAVFSRLSPVLQSTTTFAKSRTEWEQAHSYRVWQDGLDFLSSNIPEHSVIASDPLTSYSVTAFTKNYVVCTFDQHGPPNDVLLEERIKAARDILSPYVTMRRSLELLETHRATHVVLNRRLPEDFVLHYWSMNREVFPDVERKFSRYPDLFERIYDHDGFIVFRWTRTELTEDVPTLNPYLETVPDAFDRIGLEAGEATLEAAQIGTGSASRGQRIAISLVWSSDRTYPLRNYVVSIRFDRIALTLPLDGKPFPKISRKLKEAADGHRYRFRAHHKIRGGFFGPEAWGPGTLILDENEVSVPMDIAPGDYIVYAKLLAEPAKSNYRLRDFFFDDDIYQGVPIGRVSVE